MSVVSFDITMHIHFAGSYNYRFIAPGTYYFSSGCVKSDCSILMNGKVVVTDYETVKGVVSATLKDLSATHPVSYIDTYCCLVRGKSEFSVVSRYILCLE